MRIFVREKKCRDNKSPYVLNLTFKVKSVIVGPRKSNLRRMLSAIYLHVLTTLDQLLFSLIMLVIYETS